MGRVFQRTVERYPERTAVIDDDADVRYTYNEWNQRVNRFASALEEKGIGPGDRVGVVMQPRVQVGTIYWGIQKCGAAFVPYNVRAAADELQFLVDNAEPELLVYSAVAKDAIDKSHKSFSTTDDLIYIGEDVPSYARGFSDLVKSQNESFKPVNVDSDETSVILHTSGTTGRPKGVPRSHMNTYSAGKSHVIQSQWSDNETTLGLMPIYHTMGLRTLVTMAILSGTWVAQRSFSPDQTVDLIESEKITSLYLVPTIFHDIVKSSDIDAADISSVKRLGYAGTLMTEPVQERVREKFDPEIFINHYGSTEVYTYSTCSWIDSKPGSAGRAGINTRVRVVSPQQGETVSPRDIVDPDELGEIIVDATSPEAFDGYLDRPEADEKAFEDDWYFTGDLGYRDQDGDLFVVGRVDDMIISGGENIYPVEVENVLEGSEGVSEVAVVGLNDERWSQIVTAFVVPEEEVEPFDFTDLADKLDMYCRESADLADFKRPRKYVFINEIIKSNVGKILRRELTLDDIDSDIYAVVDT